MYSTWHSIRPIGMSWHIAPALLNSLLQTCAVVVTQPEFYDSPDFGFRLAFIITKPAEHSASKTLVWPMRPSDGAARKVRKTAGLPSMAVLRCTHYIHIFFLSGFARMLSNLHWENCGTSSPTPPVKRGSVFLPPLPAMTARPSQPTTRAKLANSSMRSALSIQLECACIRVPSRASRPSGELKQRSLSAKASRGPASGLS